MIAYLSSKWIDKLEIDDEEEEEGKAEHKDKDKDKGKTRPSRPIRCDVWIVERMRYQPTNRQTDQRTQPVIEVLCRT